MENAKYNFRGIVGVDLTEKEIKKFSNGVVSYLYSNNYTKSVIIAKDNRITSDYILSMIKNVLLSKGIIVYVIGVATTPELVYLTRRFKFNLGLMITASHNSYEYNGLKCFNNLGEVVDVNNLILKHCKCKKYEKVVDISKYKELYLRELKDQLNTNRIKCIFDCANGASVDVVRNLFPRHQIIGGDTTGKYINNSCGTENLDSIKSLCKRDKKIGFAFDGDGDRVIAIDSDGEIIDGDKILYILATQQLNRGEKIVGTQISSLGLETALKNQGIELVRERVGAKYVYKRMLKENAILGGEPCGHIFTSKYYSSDGVGVVIELLNILNRTGLSFKQLLSGYKQMYKIGENIDIEDVKNIIEYEQTCNDMKVVVRKSATEAKVRIFIEGIDEKLVQTKFEQIKKDLITM